MPDITFSKKFLQELKALRTVFEERLITEEEFSQKVDELREREAKLHEPMGRILLMQKIEEFEKDVENEIKAGIQLKKTADTRQLQEQRREKEAEARRKQQEKKAEEQRKQDEEIKKGERTIQLQNWHRC